MLKKIPYISDCSVFNCFILFFESKKISDVFNCSIICFFFESKKRFLTFLEGKSLL